MNRALDVHAAQLITAAVEVKTLTIRGKQVTLAVFRQLEEKPLLLENGSLAGIPWGRVNYHPDKCSDDISHMHVVWQEGMELRRARVRTRAHFSEPFWADGISEDFVVMRLRRESCDGFKKIPSWIYLGDQQWVDGKWRKYVCFNYGELKCSTTIEGVDLMDEVKNRPPADSVTDEDVERWMATSAAEETSRRERVRSTIAMLSELSQLFIAV